MKKLDVVSTITVVCIILLSIFMGINFGFKCEEYNNGICPNCGNHYEFLQAASSRNSKTYIYKCNGCGNIVEMPWLQ